MYVPIKLGCKGPQRTKEQFRKIFPRENGFLMADLPNRPFICIEESERVMRIAENKIYIHYTNY